jgi:hypothetical protein
MVQKEKVLENMEILKHRDLERRVKGVVGTCSRKLQTLF